MTPARQPQRVDTHEPKHAQAAQRALRLLEAGRIELVALIEQQPPADHPLPGPHMERVRELHHELRRAIGIAVKDVAVVDDDRIDRLGGLRG